MKDKYEWHSGMTSGPGNDEITITKTDTQGVNLQHNFSIGKHRVILGGQWDRIEVKSSRNVGAPYSPNSRYDTYGMYSEGRLSLLNNRVLLSAGLRYDYFENRILSTPGITSLKPRKENLDHITARGGIEERPMPERIKRLTDRIKAWINLQDKPNQEKRIALIYYNYPPGKQNIGASYLNVLPEVYGKYTKD